MFDFEVKFGIVVWFFFPGCLNQDNIIIKFSENFSQDAYWAQDANWFLQNFLPGRLFGPGRLLGTSEYVVYLHGIQVLESPNLVHTQ